MSSLPSEKRENMIKISFLTSTMLYTSLTHMYIKKREGESFSFLIIRDRLDII
tara:strand:- start:481 stop:639 length:159 start_codon:yes stop_codon:yes gene_type:complete